MHGRFPSTPGSTTSIRPPFPTRRTSLRLEAVDVDTSVTVGGALRSFVLGTSYNVDRFYSETFERLVRQVVSATSRPTSSSSRASSCVPYVPALRAATRARLVLRSLNVEHEIWVGLARGERHLLRRLYLRHLARRLREFEVVHTERRRCSSFRSAPRTQRRTGAWARRSRSTSRRSVSTRAATPTVPGTATRLPSSSSDRSTGDRTSRRSAGFWRPSGLSSARPSRRPASTSEGATLPGTSRAAFASEASDTSVACPTPGTSSLRARRWSSRSSREAAFASRSSRRWPSAFPSSRRGSAPPESAPRTVRRFSWPTGQSVWPRLAPTLLSDRKRAIAVGRAGRQFVHRCFDADAVGRRLFEFLRALPPRPVAA